MSDPTDPVDDEDRSPLVRLLRNPQVQTALRQALVALSGVLIGRGILTAADVDLARAILEIAAPFAILVATIVWGQMKRTPRALVKDVKAMPEVAGVVVKNEATGPLKEMAMSQKPEDQKIVTENMAVISGGQSSGGASP